MMRRRELITLAGGAAATWPLSALAQQQAMPVMGLLSSRSLDDSSAHYGRIRAGPSRAGIRRAAEREDRDRGLPKGTTIGCKHWLPIWYCGRWR